MGLVNIGKGKEKLGVIKLFVSPIVGTVRLPLALAKKKVTPTLFVTSLSEYRDRPGRRNDGTRIIINETKKGD